MLANAELSIQWSNLILGGQVFWGYPDLRLSFQNILILRLSILPRLLEIFYAVIPEVMQRFNKFLNIELQKKC